jgi:transcriptional regulator with XRE-family HTH domain
MRLTTIKLLRLKQGLLQIEVAWRARIPRARLSEIENAHRQPAPSELERLAAVLNVPVDRLVHGDGP